MKGALTTQTASERELLRTFRTVDKGCAESIMAWSRLMRELCEGRIARRDLADSVSWRLSRPLVRKRVARKGGRRG
jgi:hypothetical protein